MSKAAFTIFVYSFYLFLMGLGMMILPNTLLTLFGFLPTTEIWIRVLGVFTFVVGIYYLCSALYEQVAFFQATTIGRIFFFLMMLVFVFVFRQSYMLAVIGTVDLLGAIWTFSAKSK